MRVGTSALKNTLVAVDVSTGRQLWRKEDARVAPYTLAAKDGRVVYHDLSELICLDAKTGRDRWRAKNPVGQIPSALSSLVVKDGVVLYHGQKQSTQPAAGGGKGRKRRGRPGQYLTALSLADGKPLWDCRGSGPISAACTQPTEVFVAKGVVWCGLSTKGYDLRTGEARKQVNLYKLISPGHHRRCLRGKATVNYVIRNKRGAEFIDLNGDKHMRHDWLRTPCFTGATLANGIFYKPPDQCFCYPGVMVEGYFAMASDPVAKLKASTAAALRKGDAYGRAAGGPKATDEDWPMHRRDGQRSGWTKTAVPAQLGKKWEIKLSSQGTQPVIVGDRLWVAEKDIHTIRCLDARTGRDVWSFVAGGRVDSAPTVHEGSVIFGCRDGSVYCLRADDGALSWRFRAAPDERRVVSFEQVESLWPVHGSVLVRDGTVYFAAGRSSFLDGGIIVYGLDAKTGKVLCHHVLEGPRPDIKKDVGRPFAMDGALPDLLVGGKSGDLYMRRIKFDAKLNRLPTKRESSLGELDMGESHLVATGGFLDGSGYDRIYWMHSRRWPGFYLAPHSPKSGQLVVFDEGTTYALKYFYRRHQWSPKFFPQEKGYLLFADDIDNEPGFIERGKKTIEWLPPEARRDSHRRGGRNVEKGTGYVRHKPEKWQKMIPVRARAMVLAADRLFIAGPPDKVVAGDPLAAFEGRAGAVLQVFSAEDGSLVKSLELPSPPAFDGMSAAGGRLYLATRDGKVICF
jgi:outer membrane protein assembly factor BamB